MSDDPNIVPRGDATNCAEPVVNIDFDDWSTVKPIKLLEALLPNNFWSHIKGQNQSICQAGHCEARRTNILKDDDILASWKTVTISELKKFVAIVIHMGLVPKQRYLNFICYTHLCTLPLLPH